MIVFLDARRFACDWKIKGKYPLFATICSYDIIHVSFNLGHRRDFVWRFVVAHTYYIMLMFTTVYYLMVYCITKLSIDSL